MEAQQATASPKWTVDRTINLPMVWIAAASLVAFISMVNTISYRVSAAEQAQTTLRGDMVLMRTELSQQQSQQRIEQAAANSQLESEIKQEIRILRDLIDRKTISSR
jgi:hypothetical protein